MRECPVASARATIGGPSFESRTPSRNASFHEPTMLSPGAWSIRPGGRRRPSREVLAARGACRPLRRRRGPAGETCRRLTAKRVDGRGLPAVQVHASSSTPFRFFAIGRGGREAVDASLPVVLSRPNERENSCGRRPLRGQDPERCSRSCNPWWSRCPRRFRAARRVRGSRWSRRPGCRRRTRL